MSNEAGNGGMSFIVKNTACVMAVPVVVFGLYIVLHGHLTPGGGFAGGAIMATLAVLFGVAFGKGFFSRAVHVGLLSALEGIGLAAFALLAFLGLGSSFFRNWLVGTGFFFGSAVPFGPNPGFLGTGGVIPLMNIAVGLEVFAALSMVVVLMFSQEAGK
jgi:multicomponent Na+:H+ antiporter subunit B